MPTTFFSRELFDLLESFTWDYLVKVKLKNQEKLLGLQTWVSINGDNDFTICEFTYKGNGWSKSWVPKAMRSVKEYVKVEYPGEKQIVPIYQYVCDASNYDLDALGLHELYKQRSTSKTWIEQAKGHTMAGTTLTNNFWANDILWQLNVLAYNLSVMMRQWKSKFKKQEHRTFIDWFIAVPAKITSGGHQIELRMNDTIFIRSTGKSSTGSLKRHNNRKEENTDTNSGVYGRGTFT